MDLFAIAHGLKIQTHHRGSLTTSDDSTSGNYSLVHEDGSIAALKEEPATLDPFVAKKKLFVGHSDAVKALCVDAVTSRLYSASWDETVAVWNIPTRTLIGVLPHGCWVNAVALVSPKGGPRVIATGSEDGFVSFWSPAELLLLYQIRPGHGPITHLCVLKDLVFAASMTVVYGISAATGTAVREYREKVNVTSIAAHDDLLYCGMEDGRILGKEIVGGFVLRELTAHTEAVKALALHPESNTLASGGEDGGIKLWALSTGVCTATLPKALHKEAIQCLAFHSRDPQDRYLLSGSTDGTVKCTRLLNNLSLTMLGFLPNCMLLVGGRDHSSPTGKGARGWSGIGVAVDSSADAHGDPLSPSVDNSFSFSLGSVIPYATLIAADYAGIIQMHEVEIYEDRLKRMSVAPLAGKQSGDGTAGSGGGGKTAKDKKK